MYCYVDLRYALPPLANLSSLVLVTSPSDSWEREDVVISKILQYPILVIPLFVVAILTLFLPFTSIKLPFIVQPVRLQTGRFSGPAALMLLAAIIFSPPLFWFFYLVLIIVYPRHGILFNPFKCTFHWFHHNLQSIPPLILVCITRRRQNTALSPAHQVQAELVDIEDHAMQDVNPYRLTIPSGNGQKTERNNEQSYA